MINVKETFLELTSRRYPNGTEHLAMDIVKKLLPLVEFTEDQFGNYYVNILNKNGEFSDSMFTSHLDTIDSGPWKQENIWDTELKRMVKNPAFDSEKLNDKSITHVIDADFIKTDGETNLGADDKAGTTIMINMISENVPGLYYFFVGEESGCIGSSALSRVFRTKDFQTINRCISFDRRGYDSVITHQHGICCSDVFANEVADRLNEYGFWYKPDPTGIYTDSAEFTDVIPECTNISVGYFSEHTKSERQDIEFLELLAIVSTKIEWDTLPTVRQKSLIYNGKKSTTYNRQYGGDYDGYGGDWGGGYGGGYSNYNNKSTTDYSKKKADPSNIEEFKEVITDSNFNDWYEEQRLINFD